MNYLSHSKDIKKKNCIHTFSTLLFINFKTVKVIYYINFIFYYFWSHWEYTYQIISQESLKKGVLPLRRMKGVVKSTGKKNVDMW